jgi:hypothetical protein
MIKSTTFGSGIKRSGNAGECLKDFIRLRYLHLILLQEYPRFWRSPSQSHHGSRPDADTRLCDDKTFVEQYGFDGAQFTKNAGSTDFAGRLDDGAFDMESIMMYPSNAFLSPERKTDKIDKCSMVAIDRIGDKMTGTSWVHTG